MNASLRFMPDTLKQKGSAGKMLIWMQDNESRCKNTNIAVLAKTIEMSGIGINVYTAKSMLQKMINNQMLHRYGGRKRSTFIINYYHKDIPGYILDRAPAEVKERVERMKAELAPNQHISVEGCVVTEQEKEEPEPTEDTATQVKPELEPVVISNEPQEETPNVSSDISEENTTSVPVKVMNTERGLSISITLNLNIN